MNEKINGILNNVTGYPLDKSQRNIVLSNGKHILVSAGAGSGKSLTIIGKIRYLIEIENISEDEILCISFTNKSMESLKNKLNCFYDYNVFCYTFHKLGYDILKKENYFIDSNDTLSYVIDEYFETLLFNKQVLKNAVKFFSNKKIVFNYYKEYKKINYYDIKNTKKLIYKFINLFKANNYDHEYFLAFFNKVFGREKRLLYMIFNVYYIYQKELKSSMKIDFNDMISMATSFVDKNGFFIPLKYIIIDEYQDTSKVRFDLINSILDATGASLLVVGDDFQSIYRFTGCDLDIFLKFDDFFSDAITLKIENTYRNSQELIDIAGSFIMRNDRQLEKNLKSSKNLIDPIVIIYYKNIVYSFIRLIEKIYALSNSPILILGRNNFDINSIVDSYLFERNGDNIIYLNNKNIKLKYMTVHKSKGLEEENVIVLNMIDDKLGFPNKTKNERILRFVSSSDDYYPFEEERRLFYVAITRTKNKVYLMTQKNKESIFVHELKKDYNIKSFYL